MSETQPIAVGDELKCKYDIGGRGTVCQVVAIGEHIKKKVRMITVRFKRYGTEVTYSETYINQEFKR